jgi:hypothetical protein
MALSVQLEVHVNELTLSVLLAKDLIVGFEWKVLDIEMSETVSIEEWFLSGLVRTLRTFQGLTG